MNTGPIVEVLAAAALAYFAKRHPDIVWPETPAELNARLSMVAEMEVRACDEEFPAAGFPGGMPREACVAMIDTLAKWESGLWVTVHSGEKKGPSGETCLVQIHSSASSVPDPRFRVTRAEWLTLAGTDPASTLRCLRAGVRILGWHAKRCSIKWAGSENFTFQAQRLFAEYHRPGPWGECLGLAPLAYDRSHYAARTLRRITGQP